MARTDVVKKAAQMITEDRVGVLKGATAVVVEGDTHTYTVVVYDSGKSWCPCKATTVCSHRLAAQMVVDGENR
jgi:hypothetical protein